VAGGTRGARRTIVQNIAAAQELPVITWIRRQLEQVLQDSMAGGDTSPGFEPGLADRISRRSATVRGVRTPRASRRAAVAPKIRPGFAR